MAEWSVFIIVLELRNDENYNHTFNFNKLFIITLSSHYNYNELLFQVKRVYTSVHWRVDIKVGDTRKEGCAELQTLSLQQPVVTARY